MHRLCSASLKTGRQEETPTTLPFSGIEYISAQSLSNGISAVLAEIGNFARVHHSLGLRLTTDAWKNQMLGFSSNSKAISS